MTNKKVNPITEVINHFKLTNDNRIKAEQVRAHFSYALNNGYLSIDKINDVVSALYSKELLIAPKGRSTWSQSMLDFNLEVEKIARDYVDRRPEDCRLSKSGKIIFFDRNQNDRSFSSNFANETLRAMNRKASENKTKLDTTK